PCRSARRLMPAGLCALLLVLGPPPAALAKMFRHRPPPVPLRSVPEPPSGPAMNPGPPSGPAAAPAPLPAPITQPPVSAAPLAVPPAAAAVAAPGQAVLALTARYGKDLPVVNSGLVWRIYADKPDA
ncbi:hypothetical protein CEE95_14235, partial [Lactobacillus crispatus]